MTEKKVYNGFSTLEIVISLFIFSVVASALITTAFGGQSMLSSSLAFQEIFPKTKAEIKNAFLFFQNNFSGDYGVQNNEVLMEEYLIDDFTKKIITSSQNNVAKAELFSFVTNRKESVGGDTCFRKLSEAESYSVKNKIFLSEISATDIDVVRGKAYIALDTSGMPNFLVVDVDDSENPNLISENLGTERRINALHVAGKYAFLATNSTLRQIQIVNILDSSNPELLSEYRLPDPSSTTTPSNIFYKNEKIYLGTAKHTGGQEFHVIDVFNPELPQRLGSWEADSKVNNIFVEGDVVYLGSTNPTPFKILNIENPQSVLFIDDYDTGGNSNHGAKGLSLINNLLVGGRSVGLINENYHELFVFDISEGNLNLISSKHIGNSVKDLIARENVLVLAAAHAQSRNVIEFRSLEEDSMLDLLHEIDLEEKPTAIDCEEDILYVVSESPSKLIIIEPDK